MITTYKGYTLIFDFSGRGYLVPTTIKDFNGQGKDVKVEDVAIARRLIDKALGE